ncbi:MAG: right-handed parallel beta-helix repeat-containing protein [Lachnospiraceae bacterium]|nr:right-handed parallel beta-helix repeat-containing protein [Lachnospiraceae bacterium]
MKYRWMMLIFAIFFLAQPMLVVKAGVVAPANGGETEAGVRKYDNKAIQAELDKTGEVTLVNGGVYYLSKPIYLSDGDSFDATGATVYCGSFIFMGPTSKPGYDSLKNVTLKGGKWRSTLEDGFTQSSFHIRHARDITISDMDIKVSNYEGHTMEFVACKNVTVENCKIMPLGKAKKNSVEEQIQIDIAAPSTASDSKEATDGSTCDNIKIIGCTVKGCRAVCCNYAAVDRGKYLNKFHTNITIKNCTLTGVSGQALALFNTTSAVVTGNKIISKAPASRNYYAIGCHAAFFGKAPGKIKKRNLNISKNVIKGVNYGLLISSSTSSQFNKLTLKNNKLYAKKGAESALSVRSVKEVKKSGNKTAKWK